MTTGVRMRRNTKQAQSGFSLIEMMVVLFILSVMLAAVFAQISNVQARSAAEQTKLDIFQESREFMDQVVRDMHQAGYPNTRNYATSPAVTSTTNAVGLVKVDVGQLWFEGDVDGTGVSSVQYYIQSTGNNCPCLRRSQTPKQVGNPLTGQGTAASYAEVQNVQNGTSANPIFYAYKADGTQVTLPVDFNSDATTIAQIKTIRVVLAVQSNKYDFQARLYPQTTLNANIKLNNCSQAATGQAMSCR
jgi:prepilin-type N-terminal cleavage/methylation domain-containing protein